MNAAATLIPLEAVEPAMMESLLDRAFGADRHTRTAYAIRNGTQWLPALSFAVLDSDEMLVGTIQVWPVALSDADGRRHPMLMVGPVAVIPERQGEGFGLALMAAMNEALSPPDAPATPPLPQVLIGDPDYYNRFGFHANATQGWSLPGPYDKHRLLVRAANPAVLPEHGTLGPWIG